MLFEGRVLGNNQFCKTNSRKKAIYMETDNCAKQTVAKKAIYIATTNFTVWPEPI